MSNRIHLPVASTVQDPVWERLEQWKHSEEGTGMSNTKFKVALIPEGKQKEDGDNYIINYTCVFYTFFVGMPPFTI